MPENNALQSGARVTFGYDSPLIRRAPRQAPRLRLFCFPHAGAGASAFGEWPSLLPEDIEVAAIALPGREDRLTEQAATHTTALIRALTQAIRPYLGQPLAFFGHSGGALLAFELARVMRQRLRTEPVHLFLSGQPAPQVPQPAPIHALPDAEFSGRIRELGGIHPDVLADEQALNMMMVAVRADFALWENHEYKPGKPLAAPITAFGGESDPRTGTGDLDAWAEHTTGTFRLRMFPGGHFFVNDERDALLDDIVRDLKAVG